MIKIMIYSIKTTLSDLSTLTTNNFYSKKRNYFEFIDKYDFDFTILTK